MKAKELISKFAMVAALAVALVATREASAQITNFSGQTGTQPYYSVSNMVLQGVGILATDKIIAGIATTPATNTYINGTNYFSGGTLIQGGTSRSRYVAFGVSCVGTNASATGSVAAYIDGSTGNGDWLTLSPPIVAPISGTTVGGTNATIDVGGLVLFRVRHVRCTETNYTTTYSVSMSSKPGI